MQPALVPLLQASGFTGVIAGRLAAAAIRPARPAVELAGRVRHHARTDARPKFPTWRPIRGCSRPGALAWPTTGLQGRASSGRETRPIRSIIFARFPWSSLRRWPKSRACSLSACKRTPGLEQLAALDGRFTAVDLGSTLDTEAGAFMDTAAVMCNLDLVDHLRHGGRASGRRTGRAGLARHCRRRPSGAGCRIAATALGIRRCGCFGSRDRAIGQRLRGNED